MTALRDILREHDAELVAAAAPAQRSAARALRQVRRALGADDVVDDDAADDGALLSAVTAARLRRALRRVAAAAGVTPTWAEWEAIDDALDGPRLQAADADAADADADAAADADPIDASAELARLRVLMRAVIEQVPLAVAIVEAPSGRRLIANERNVAILGRLAPEAAAGIDGYGVYEGFRDDGTRLGARDWPVARSLISGEVVNGEVVELRRGDGTTVFIRISASPIKDDAGQTVAAISIFEDVTAERHLQDGVRFLAEASQLLGSSLDYEQTLKTLATLAVPRLGDWCAVEMLRPDGTSEQLAVAHIDPTKVELAVALRDRWPPDPAAARGMPHVLRTGAAELWPEVTDEMLVEGASDAEHLAHSRALGLRSAMVVPIVVNARVLGALTIVAAESGRRYTPADLLLVQEVAARAGLAVENAALYRTTQDAVRMREDFLAVASHELKTPLTALHLQVARLQGQAKKGPVVVDAERLERLDRQVGRLMRLVEQLLDVSRLTAGKLALDVGDVDLRELAAAAIGRVDAGSDGGVHGGGREGVDEGTGITLTSSGPAVGRWDKGRLEQVLANLIGNATKYGAGKPIDVDVSGDNDVVRLTVTDRGIGIPLADHERIFHRFERAVSASNFGGIGLGLWIVQQIVAAHRGTVSVKSIPGEGASFMVALPRRPSEVSG